MTKMKNKFPSRKLITPHLLMIQLKSIIPFPLIPTKSNNSQPLKQPITHQKECLNLLNLSLSNLYPIPAKNLIKNPANRELINLMKMVIHLCYKVRYLEYARHWNIARPYFSENETSITFKKT